MSPKTEQTRAVENTTKFSNRSEKGISMRTIDTVEIREGGHRPAATNPVAIFEVSVPNSKTDDHPLTIRVTVSRANGDPEPLRRIQAGGLTRAEDEAIDEEDVITQAEEANALDPVG